MCAYAHMCAVLSPSYLHLCTLLQLPAHTSSPIFHFYPPLASFSSFHPSSAYPSPSPAYLGARKMVGYLPVAEKRRGKGGEGCA